MNLQKALIAGAVGGVVNAVYGFIMHGMIMGGTYTAQPELFRQDANMMWFPIISILIGIVGGMIFAKTYSSWKAGVMGGVTFGFWIGLLPFLATFFNPLIFKGYPYYLAWCTGAILLLGWMVYGAVVATLYKGQAA